MNRHRKLILLTGLATLLFGAVALLGWRMNHAALITVVPLYAEMTFNTALCFVLLGLAFIFTQQSLRLALCASVALLSGLVLTQSVFVMNFGMDNLFFDHAGAFPDNPYPGRMSPPTIIAFLFSAVTMLLLSQKNHRPWVKTFTNLLIAVVGASGLFGLTMLLMFPEKPLSLVYPLSMSGMTAVAFLTVSMAMWGVYLQIFQDRAATDYFLPATRLMFRLSYPGKFILIGLVFVVPLSLSMQYALDSLNRNIERTQIDLGGMVFINGASGLIEAIQKHRGMLNAQMHGARSFVASLKAEAEAVNSYIAVLGEQLSHTDNSLFNMQQWVEIAKQWQRVRGRDIADDPQQLWEVQTDMITSLLRLIQRVGNNFSFNLESRLSFHNMSQAAVDHLPQVMELVGQARGLGVGFLALKKIDAVGKFKISNLLNRMSLQTEKTVTHLYMINREQIAIEHLIIPLINDFQHSVVQFRDVANRALMEQEGFSVSVDAYFSQGTQVLEHGSRLQSIMLDYLTEVLRHEISDKHIQQYLIKSVAVIALLLLVYLFVAFYRSVMMMIKSLDEAAERMKRGEMGELDLHSADELGQVVQSFNSIASELTRVSSHMQAVVDYAAEGIITIDEAGDIHSFNPAAEKIFGYSAIELIGGNITQLMPEEYRPMHKRGLARYVEQGDTRIVGAAIELEGLKKDGAVFPLDLSVNEMQLVKEKRMFIGMVRDTTAEKEAQTKMEHTQRLESLGVLAGGIAHDFNNILAVIMGNVGLAERKLESTSSAKAFLSRIEESTRHAADLCKQMLAYSGKGQFIVGPVNLSNMVEEITRLMEVSIDKNVEIKFHFEESLPNIEADSGQIQQVILNLITNANEAMEGREGIIEIDTGVAHMEADDFKAMLTDKPLSRGRYVYLQVSDTGCGMNAETIKRIFDPFFTTKFTGRGLGMSAVLGIINGHNGGIQVNSEPGKGATFKILLPAGGGEIIKAVESVQEPTDWQGRGMVLIVDDEEFICEVASIILEEMGYSTVVAEDGLQAVEVYRRQQDEIVGVLLDMTMPKMDGTECFRQLRKINPDVKVVLSSGYDKQNATCHLVGEGLAGFIQKPYSPEALQEKMQQLQIGLQAC